MSGEAQFHVVIPARFASTRLPGKPLLEIAGRPMLQHVHDRAVESGAASVFVATDDERVAEAARGFGARVCMTSPAHGSGTERIAEAVAQLGMGADEIVVNLQGDEPLMAPATIRATALALAAQSRAPVATACCPLADAAAFANPNVVKVIRDRDGYAICFSRAPVPWPRDRDADPLTVARHHLGVYAYRVEFLGRITALPACAFEQVELLEQLRFLYYGFDVQVAEVEVPEAPGVDTAEDLARVRAVLEARSE